MYIPDDLFVSVEAEVCQSVFFKMQWNAPRTLFRLARRRTCLEPLKAGPFGHCQNLRGPLLSHSPECRRVLVAGPQKRWLHGSAAQCAGKERKTSGHAPQPAGLHRKEGKQDFLPKRVLSSKPTAPETPGKKEELDPLQDTSISLYQRFKRTFRQYGKVLIPVHLITSGVWFGTFYYAAMK